MDKKNIKSKNWIDLGVTSSETEPESIKKLMFQLLPATLLKDVKNDQDLNKQFDTIFEKIFKEVEANEPGYTKDLLSKELLHRFNEFDLSQILRRDDRIKVNGFIKYLTENKHDDRKQVTPFNQYLNIGLEEKREAFANELKNEFNKARAKEIRYMIEGLKNTGILVIKKRQMMGVFLSLEVFFNHDIGTYESIFTMLKIYEGDTVHSSHIKTAEMQINSILKKLHIKM